MRTPIMRIAITAILGVLFFATAIAPAQPGGNSTASMSTTPPNEIGGKTLDEWIRQIKIRIPAFANTLFDA